MCNPIVKSLLFALLLFPSQAWASWTFIDSSTGRSFMADLTTATTDSADFTGADTVFLVASNSNGVLATPVITDSVGGNTWTMVTNYGSNGGAMNTRLFRCASCNVDNAMTITATTSGSSSAFGLVALAFSGGDSMPDDQSDGNEADSVTSINAGATGITPSGDGYLIIAGYAGGVTGATIDDGFSTIVQIDGVGGESWGAGASYFIQTSAAAVNPTFSVASGNYATVLASFKPAGSGVGKKLLLNLELQ